MGHLKDNNETYWSHFRFAGGMGISLITRGVFNLLHAVLPDLTIPKCLHLKETKKRVDEWNAYADARTERS